MTQLRSDPTGYLQAPIGAAAAALGATLYDPATDKVYVKTSSGWVYVGTGLDVGNTVVTLTGIVVPGMVNYGAILGAGDAAATQYDLTDGDGPMEGILQPDVPRNIALTITDANTSITDYEITITGVLANGAESTETFVFADGLTPVGVKAWATVTSIDVVVIEGAGATDTLDADFGEAIGLPVPVGATAVTLVKVTADGADETADATLDADNATVVFDTAPDDTTLFAVWFNSTVTPVAVTHNHAIT